MRTTRIIGAGIVTDSMNLLDDLNPEQLAAVTLPDEPALILAGAGTGKTRVLTTRIAWLIQHGQRRPPTMLAVTFTNKAAKEMMARLAAMLPIDTRGMWIGTFHGLCNRMLRAHYRDAGLPQTFQILDSADQLSAIKRLMKAPERRRREISAARISSTSSTTPRSRACARKTSKPPTPSTRKFVELYEAYEQQCQREGVVDFAELLLRCYELLAHNPPLREHYQARFRHILVDEFQDTNKLQYAWLKMLAGEHSAMFAVGDDDQSIYAFRGANVGNMRDFEREFHVRNMIKLEQNYRSHGHILDAANSLIANNSRRLGKNLRTDAGHGEPVRVYEAATDTQEARLDRRGDQGADQHARRVAQRDRDAVPQQRAVAHHRAHAGQRGHSVPRVWRPALLRAPGSEARARLSAPDRQPERRHRVRARRQLPDARHRRALRSSNCRTRRARAAAACSSRRRRVAGKGGGRASRSSPR